MKLFEQENINGMTLKNRFFKSATWEALATDEGKMTDELFAVYEELSKGGVGTILTGYAYVTKDEKPNPGMMGIYDDSFIEEYKNLTETMHANNTNIVLQIVYGGSMSTLNPPSERILGASSIKNERTGILPIEMTKEDIATIKEAYVQAARRAEAAGFDGVQLHAAHGYMMSQFLCPHYNQRTDEYGGSIENRARILVEIVSEMRKVVSKEFPIMIKINSEDFMEDGLTSEESIIVGQLLEKVGLDAIEVSGGNESCVAVLENNLGPARKMVNVRKGTSSYFANHAAKLVKSVSIPVILTGGNRDFSLMENLHNEEGISFFAIGRPLIREANLIDMWTEDSSYRAKCASCNKCYFTHGKRCYFNIE